MPETVSNAGQGNGCAHAWSFLLGIMYADALLVSPWVRQREVLVALFFGWNWEPSIILPLALAAGWYGKGLTAVWRRAGVGHGVRVWQAALFGGGLLTLVVALLSPVDTLSDDLFSVHMTQHLLLLLVAAPLLAFGRPVLPGLWAMPMAWRRPVGRCARQRAVRGLWRMLCRPSVAWVLQTIAVWSWHVPVMYQAALGNEAIHALEHACFLATALVFWWGLADLGKSAAGYGVALLAVLATMVQSSALGALLAFATTPWYPGYAGRAAAYGLTTLQDQQLAGLVMWIPSSVIYLGAALVVVALWFQAAEREALAAAPPAHRIGAPEPH